MVAVAAPHDIYVIYGCDSGNPPLLGQTACETQLNVHRMKEYPWEVVVLGEPAAPMDRRQADVEALEFALRLGRDEVDLSHLPGKLSGRRAWELWLAQLKDPELCGPHFYHANVLGHLRQNRSAAVGYLHAMSERHSEPACAALTAAAAAYEVVLGNLNRAQVSKEAFRTDRRRQPLISVLQEAMMLETTALQRVEEALRCTK